MGPKHLLLLAAIGSAFLQDADMDYNDEDVTNFFDEVVVPMREAAKEALRPQAVVGPTNASSLQCSADQLTVRILEADRKLVIVGGGPAGFSAATYAARADLEPLVVARDFGQLEGTSTVDNYPGFPEGIDAVDMVQRFEKQATRFGAQIKWCAGGVR
jgi:NADPH-dependent 2,4-dienoyl-CoA reductase/sulfur reductase-like enzyme